MYIVSQKWSAPAFGESQYYNDTMIFDKDLERKV